MLGDTAGFQFATHKCLYTIAVVGRFPEALGLMASKIFECLVWEINFNALSIRHSVAGTIMEVAIFLKTRIKKVMPCCGERVDAGQDCCLILDNWPSSNPLGVSFPRNPLYIYLSTLGVVVQFWSRMLPDGLLSHLDETMLQMFGQVLPDGLWYLPCPILRLNNGSWVKARDA